MKNSVIKTIMIAVLPLFAVSCIDNVPSVEVLPQDAVSFNYEILGDYALDYYIDSDITFTSTSPTKGEAVWDFGDGEMGEGIPISHHYDEPGTYNVSCFIYKSQDSVDVLDNILSTILKIKPTYDTTIIAVKATTLKIPKITVLILPKTFLPFDFFSFFANTFQPP